MIKFESYQAIKNNNNTANNGKLDSAYALMIILFWFEKKFTKEVSCSIICNLTPKPMPTFWVGDQIKAKLIELRFRCHMPGTRL